jgi:hypothetical protein
VLRPGGVEVAAGGAELLVRLAHTYHVDVDAVRPFHARKPLHDDVDLHGTRACLGEVGGAERLALRADYLCLGHWPALLGERGRHQQRPSYQHDTE